MRAFVPTLALLLAGCSSAGSLPQAPDLAAAGQALDMHATGDMGAALAAPDLAPVDTCPAAVSCLNECTDPDVLEACLAGCQARATPQSWQLLADLMGCLDQACPGTDGGVCTDTSTTACQECYASVQAEGGPCAAALAACDAGT